LIEDLEMNPDDGPPASEPEADLLRTYTPFIGDVPLSAYAEPFPVPGEDLIGEEEIDARRQALRRKLHSTNFSPPLPLSDFCLIAEQRWAEESEANCRSPGCMLL
jgi:hypothetical protein